MKEKFMYEILLRIFKYETLLERMFNSETFLNNLLKKIPYYKSNWKT